MGLPSGFVARPAVPADAAGVTSCVIAAYRHYVDRNGKVPAPMRDDYGKVIAECDVTVIEHDGGVVAVLVVKETSEGFLLDNIAVAPTAQGLGLGRYLLALAEDKACTAGHESIYLYTQEVMIENLALYERTGYVEYARRTEIGLDRIYLRKALA